MQPTLLGHSIPFRLTYVQGVRAYATRNTSWRTVHGKRTKRECALTVYAGLYARRGAHLRPTWTYLALGDLGRAPALSLLGVGADRPKWCPAESKMFRHADKALAGSFHGIRVVPARIVSPGAVQVGASSLRSLRRISSHSMRRSLQNGSYGSYYLLGPALVLGGLIPPGCSWQKKVQNFETLAGS